MYAGAKAGEMRSSAEREKGASKQEFQHLNISGPQKRQLSGFTGLFFRFNCQLSGLVLHC
jgi:hypothetical protein